MTPVRPVGPPSDRPSLLPPLFVAVIVVIPPQAYLRAVELFGYSHGYLAFWREFLAFDHRLCAGADCSVLPAAGFAYRHLLTAEGPWRRTLTEAIFPCYIIHQTAIVVFAHEIARLRLPLPVEIPMVVVLTALACVAGYELIRRVPWPRPAFGMKPIPTPARRAPSPAE